MEQQLLMVLLLLLFVLLMLLGDCGMLVSGRYVVRIGCGSCRVQGGVWMGLVLLGLCLLLLVGGDLLLMLLMPRNHVGHYLKEVERKCGPVKCTLCHE